MGRNQPCNHHRLALWRVVPIDRADLEQGDIGEALAGVAAGRLDQIGQGRGAHAVQVGRDRIGDHQGVIAAAEQPSRLPRQEAPGDGLGKAHGGHGPPGCAHPTLAQAQHPAGRPGHVGQGLDGQGAIALDPGDLFHQIGPALHVAAPGRRRDLCAVHGETQIRQNLVDTCVGQGKAGELAHIASVESDGTRRGGRLAGHEDVRRLTAAQVQDQPRGQLQPIDHEARIDAAGEAVLGVRRDAGGPTGLGGADRIEPGALDEHLGGLLRAAGALAAHDAAQAHRALAPGVGDHTHLRGDVVGLAVQGDQLLVMMFGGRGFICVGRSVRIPAGAQARHDQIAHQLGPVIDVQGPGAVVGDQVGDIHQGVDRPQADGDQPLLQPGRRGTVLHAADQPAGKDRAGVRRVQPNGYRAGEGALHRGDRGVLQPAEARGGQVPGDAGHAQPVGAVRRHLEVDDRLQAQGLGG